MMPEAEGQCEVCQQPSKQKCSQCKLVFYCSPEHQKENWTTHKSSCIPYEVCTSKELGRYLVAKRDLDPGDVIFIDTPLVIGPRPHKIEDGPLPCVGCCKILTEEVFSCPECGWPACSPDCGGLKTLQLHGFECQILKMNPRKPNDSVYEYFRYDTLIILRALFLQKANKKKWDTLLNLEDHLNDRGPESNVYKTIHEKVTYVQENYIKPLKQYEQQTNQTILPQVSSDIVHKIYGTLDVNATEITDSHELFVLYPVASLLEHNCMPNTCQTIEEKDGFKITFRAALPIKKGEHITTTYTNILWGTQERRKHLKETKYLSCICKRCSDPTELGTFFSALVCLGTEEDPCKGIQLPTNPLDENCNWVCNKCGIKLPNQEINEFVDHLNKEVNKIIEKKPVLEELEEFLGKLEVFLHPNHYLAYTVKHSLVQMYRIDDGIEISNSFLNEKIKLCQGLIDVTKKIDPGNARLPLYLAVLLNELLMAKFKMLTRDFNAEDQDSHSHDVIDVLKLLDEAKRALKYEEASETGRKLLEVVKVNELKVNNWMEEHNLKTQIQN